MYRVHQPSIINFYIIMFTLVLHTIFPGQNNKLQQKVLKSIPYERFQMFFFLLENGLSLGGQLWRGGC